LRACPIPGRGVTCRLLSGARTRCYLRRRGDSACHSERHLSFVQVMDMMQEELDYPCAAPAADPPQLSGPRPAAARGEEKRRSSAGEEEFRRRAEAPIQSGAKRAQAKAAQADPVRPSPAHTTEQDKKNKDTPGAPLTVRPQAALGTPRPFPGPPSSLPGAPSALPHGRGCSGSCWLRLLPYRSAANPRCSCAGQADRS
jgi:hypothetical protein